jgi:hypothetical protein
VIRHRKAYTTWLPIEKAPWKLMPEKPMSPEALEVLEVFIRHDRRRFPAVPPVIYL